MLRSYSADNSGDAGEGGEDVRHVEQVSDGQAQAVWKRACELTILKWVFLLLRPSILCDIIEQRILDTNAGKQ